MGNGSLIRPGNIQYMSAGSGVTHSEFNPSKDEAVRLLQIWIMPEVKGARPRYAEKSLSDKPTGLLHLMVSKAGRDGSIAIRQDADLWLAKLEAGQTVSHTLAKNRNAWVHVAEGEIVLNGKTLSCGDAAAVTEETKLQFSANKPSQVLLFDLN
jgi:redox-sensitive bicupin YhaK (pirin superfamily)